MLFLCGIHGVLDDGFHRFTATNQFSTAYMQQLDDISAGFALENGILFGHGPSNQR
jgi:hypothetical protein